MDMDGRPPKRQRRSVRGSELQRERASNLSGTTRSNPVALSSRPKATSQASSSQAHSARVPSSSPSPRKSESPIKQTKFKSLHNFFQPATEGQRWSSRKFQPQRPLAPVAESTLDADIIEDDYDSYDEIFSQHLISVNPEQAVGVRYRDKSSEARSSIPRQTSVSGPKPHSARRFLMPSESSGHGNRKYAGHSSMEVDRRPWAQRFGPSSLDELAVHKKKVSDVQGWLEDAFSGRRKEKLLVLRGPAGSGKTTTVTLLSKTLGYDVIEWRNPAVSEFTAQEYISVSAHFEDFLGRGDRFGRLDLDDAIESKDPSGRPSHNRRILLVEEFPTVLNRNSFSLAAFRASLQRYLAAADPAHGGWIHPPMVMIVSETLLSSASSISENLTVHRLLGPALYNHPSTSIIDFNSIAPTFMHKALRSVLEKEARCSQRVRIPGPAVLNTMAEIGDIRSAVSSLEFLCLKDDQAGQWGDTLTKGKGKKSRGKSALTQMEEESLKMICQREASLGMFHAVGKIVYNKRLDASLMPANFPIPPPPPAHSSQSHRVKISQVAVNDLMEETGTDISTFICALHENYPPSCDGVSFVDSLNGCLEALSDSDILSADRRPAQAARQGVGIGATPLNSGVDMLRQDEISFQVAARGLLFALPYPVKRQPIPGDGRSRPGDPHKMLYPSSLRLWRKTEEIDGLVDSWIKQMLDPFKAPRPPHRNLNSPADPTGVTSWKTLQVGSPASLQGTNINSSAVTVTMMSRDDALLHQLPYMAQIRRDDPAWEQLDQITSIPGIRLDDAEEDGLPPSQPQKTKPSGVGSGPWLPPPPPEEEKLFLSDDDIVDD
ncbi:uncharacterized protein N7459_003720 [Penicillium hispanicum]|uniref:uncharacterized protein n=1 Tax=Penicillium hispanicum TaxID=1080232 RepID=UPI002541F74E|nr:uncharacterized protein N7459_003720 [Penicillium hispanicum]KAJ5587955.1 hypothetical protein N7459_003720 [Penicillium hispanicum]